MTGTRMTHADYRIRKDKLASYLEPPHEGIVFQGIQIVTLGALIGVLALLALCDIAGQGR